VEAPGLTRKKLIGAGATATSTRSISAGERAAAETMR
jgi:hypothetical protein